MSSSFQVYEQSAAMLGQANAGTGVSDDASVQFFNPAATTRFKHPTVSISGILIHGDFDFDPTSATDFFDPIDGDTKGPGGFSLVPAIYYIHPINERLVAGLGIAVPFGLETKYDDTSKARYFATDSKIITININPSLAYQLFEMLSVGVGFDIQYFDAELDQMFDFKSLNPVAPGDVGIRNDADGWGYGWNAGIMFEPDEDTRIGLSYRSKISHHAKGLSTVDGVPRDIASQHVAGKFGLRDSNVSANLTLPDSATLSIFRQVTPKLSLMADVQYIVWSRMQSLTLNFTGNPHNTDPNFNHLDPATLDFNYKNTWRFALGQNYQINDKWLVRAGVAFDQAPVDNEHRIARLPDNDRYWLAIGANYKVNEQFSVDAGYAHIFFKNMTIDQTFENPALTGELKANYRGNANIIGVQLTYKFV